MASRRDVRDSSASSREELYEGREQTLVKHEILRRYLQRFGFIIGWRWDSITYVDCFSGPWQSRSEKLADTSFAIALDELRKARNNLSKKHGKGIRIRCFFLERKKNAYRQLAAYANSIDDAEVKPHHGALEDSVDEIVRFVKQRRSFPFIFIDPTGWSGFALDTIQPLLRLKPGEVLINFMTEHIRRFIDSPLQETRESFERLFGSADFRNRLAGLAKEDRDDAAVFEHMSTVQTAGAFPYSSAALVLHPGIDRSHFHLIYLTRDPKGIEVFKESEQHAMSAMASARAKAQQRNRERKRGRELFPPEELYDPSYLEQLRDRYLRMAKLRVQHELSSKQRVLFDDVWTAALRYPLVWDADLKKWVRERESSDKLRIEGMKPRQRVPKRKQRNMLVWHSHRRHVQQDC